MPYDGATGLTLGGRGFPANFQQLGGPGQYGQSGQSGQQVGQPGTSGTQTTVTITRTSWGPQTQGTQGTQGGRNHHCCCRDRDEEPGAEEPGTEQPTDLRSRVLGIIQQILSLLSSLGIGQGQGQQPGTQQPGTQQPGTGSQGPSVIMV
jgi:hypothetical protein